MPSFIEKSCCRGRRPEGVVGRNHNLRPDITGKMLQERHAVRFLVAPTGYGKSSVAYEYAQIVFGFEHTFWVRCSSPCFLRDLDAGTLDRLVLAADAEAALVVFDDVPALNPERADAFEKMAAALLEAGVEFIATSTPASDASVHVRREKLVLRARDFLLTDEEIAIERIRGNVPSAGGDVHSPAVNIPCCIWSLHGVDTLLKGFRAEGLPASLELASVLALLFKSGTFDELDELVSGSNVASDIAYLEENYTFLGIDCMSQSFGAIDADPAKIFKSLSPNMADLVSGSSEADAETLCLRIAGVLLRKRMGSRACTFMRSFCGKEACSAWLSETGMELVLEGDHFAISELAAFICKRYSARHDGWQAALAWAAWGLGDGEKALKLCRDVMRTSASSWREKTAALLMLSCASEVSKEEFAASVGRVAMMRDMQMASGLDHEEKSDVFGWGAVLEVMRAIVDGPLAFELAWADATGVLAGTSPGGGSDIRIFRAPTREALVVMAGWVLASALRHAKNGVLMPSVISDVAQYLWDAICGPDAEPLPRWLQMKAANLLESWADSPSGDAALAPVPAAASRAQRMALVMAEQAKAYSKRREEEQRSQEEYRLTHPDPFRAKGQPRRRRGIAALPGTGSIAAPRLNIAMFGGLDIQRDDDPNTLTIRRKKARVAFAMLALNRGREISRDRLTEMLWPDTDEEFRRRNFYVVWGELKRELTVDGQCPYLLRTQTGYRLDPRFISTDLDGFEGLCRSLLFGDMDVVSWEEVFEQVSRDYSEEFLPDMCDNEYVKSLRKHYRDQLVDALIAASTRLADLGETRGSLWFAREALRRDELREDSYISLIEAQIASNQRGAALDTYFSCRRMLTEKLGIDPSPKVVELYNSIIESEESL